MNKNELIKNQLEKYLIDKVENFNIYKDMGANRILDYEDIIDFVFDNTCEYIEENEIDINISLEDIRNIVENFNDIEEYYGKEIEKIVVNNQDKKIFIINV